MSSGSGLILLGLALSCSFQAEIFKLSPVRYWTSSFLQPSTDSWGKGRRSLYVCSQTSVPECTVIRCCCCYRVRVIWLHSALTVHCISGRQTTTMKDAQHLMRLRRALCPRAGKYTELLFSLMKVWLEQSVYYVHFTQLDGMRRDVLFLVSCYVTLYFFDNSFRPSILLHTWDCRSRTQYC